MKVTLNTAPLIAVNGLPARYETVAGSTEILYPVKACFIALCNDVPQNPQTGEQKYKRYKLAQRFEKEVVNEDFTSEEIADVKSAIGNIYPPLIVGQLYDQLEGKGLNVARP